MSEATRVRLPVVLMDGDPLLRQSSAVVSDFDDWLPLVVTDMIDVMNSRNGRGLAAIQIGIPRRIIVARVADVIEIMVNPIVVRTLNRETIEREGCLSVLPRFWRDVSRPAKCEIEWQDLFGETMRADFSSEMARVLQHEIDHLDGILITDKP